MRIKHAGDHPTHVGVEHHGTSTKGERTDRCRGVVADSRQGEQCFVIVGYLTVMPFDQQSGGLMQAARSTRIPEATPGANGVTGSVGCEVGRCWPAVHPFVPDRQHAIHRCLLQHELADHHAPG